MSENFRLFFQSLFANKDQLREFIDAPEHMLAAQPISREEQRALLRFRGRMACKAQGGPANAALGWP